jgi:succinate dehydrogenase / fumarate reductase membrane anchor subunit
VAIAGIDGFSHRAMLRWIAGPVNSVMLILLTLTLAWHSSLGIKVVIEDYVHGASLKLISLILNKFVHVILAVVAVLALLKVTFGDSL